MALSKGDCIELQGLVTKCERNDHFVVTVDNVSDQPIDNKYDVLATLSGNIRRNHIRVNLGDRVRVEVSPYDTTHGRIVYRMDAVRYSASAPSSRKR